MIETTVSNFTRYMNVSTLIDRAIVNIKNDTGYYSTHDRILDHEDFKMLVGMGDKIIPYLFHYGTQQGFSWVIFLLLNTITGENPVPDENAGSFYHYIMYWLKWLFRSKYLDTDIYFGLVNEPI